MAASGLSSIALSHGTCTEFLSKCEAASCIQPRFSAPLSGLVRQRSNRERRTSVRNFVLTHCEVKESHRLHAGICSVCSTKSHYSLSVARDHLKRKQRLCTGKLLREQSKQDAVCRAAGDVQGDSGGEEREAAGQGLAAIDGVEEEEQGEGRGGVKDGEVKGSLWGAMALITGTSVGAGILALPARTAEVGFVPSATAMLICWGLLMMEALLLAEVNVSLMKAKEQQGDVGSRFVSLRTMAQDTLGPWGGASATATYIFLSYTLLVAYMAKSADVISLILGVPREVAGITFSALLGLLIFGGGPTTVDCVNRGLIVALLGLFFVIVVGGVTVVDWSSLQVMDWSATPQAIPVIFLALVYHDLVPVLCSYFGGDLRRIQQSIVLGSSLPFAMFISWEAIALALKPIAPGEDPLLSLLTLGPGPALVIQTFSLIAVATSLLGCGLGLSEFILEQLDVHFGTPVEQKPHTQKQPAMQTPERAATERVTQSTTLHPIRSDDTERPDWLRAILKPAERLVDKLRQGAELTEAPWRGLTASIEKFSVALGDGPAAREATKLVAYSLVLLPPLWMAMTTPDAFLRASDIAGAYGMTTLYGIFPPLMAWALFSSNSKGATSALPSTPLPAMSPLQSALASTFPGGRLALAGLGACACGLIIMQAVIDTSDLTAAKSMGEVILAAAETDIMGGEGESLVGLICESCTNALV